MTRSLVGQTFGRLTVVGRAQRRPHRGRFWVCICECGVESHIVREDHLISGGTKSCGCLRRATLREFRAWQMRGGPGVMTG